MEAYAAVCNATDGCSHRLPPPPPAEPAPRRLQMTGVNPIINVFTGEKEATAKAAYLAQLPKRLRFLTLVLGDDDYFYGALSFADFGIAAVLDNVLTMEPTALDEYAPSSSPSLSCPAPVLVTPPPAALSTYRADRRPLVIGVRDPRGIVCRLSRFETMKAHHKRVTSLPKVSDYMASRDPVVKFAPPSAAPAAPAAAAAPAATPAAGAGTGSGAGSAAAST